MSQERFTLLKKLGDGAYGKVMLAFDEFSSKNVALKIINKESLVKSAHINRLRREINVLRLLDHPNIVKLYEVLVSFLKTFHSFRKLIINSS
jgi:serine/threonine protein kinase